MTTEYFVKGLPQAALIGNDNTWIMPWTYTYGQALFKTGPESLAQMRLAKVLAVGTMLCLRHNQCLSCLPYKFWSWCGPPGSGHFFTWCTGQRNFLGILYHFLLIYLMSYVWKHIEIWVPSISNSTGKLCKTNPLPWQCNNLILGLCSSIFSGICKT